MIIIYLFSLNSCPIYDIFKKHQVDDKKKASYFTDYNNFAEESQLKELKKANHCLKIKIKKKDE